MRSHPDHHDAELLLRLYDLRREERLRQARSWFLRQFQAESMEDLLRRIPLGSQENDFFRMVLSYWDMAGSIINKGLITDEFFFENTGEYWAVWAKVKHLIPEMRKTWKNPHLYKNLEDLAAKYESWMNKRAPGALAAFRERLRVPPGAQVPTST